MSKIVVKKLAIAVMTLAMVIGGAHVVNASDAINEPIKLTFGHGQAEGHPYQKAALYFKELVEKNSNGSITVTVSPNGTLGDEREQVEGLQI